MNGVEEKENTEVMPSIRILDVCIIHIKRQNENSNIFVVEYVRYVQYIMYTLICVF